MSINLTKKRRQEFNEKIKELKSFIEISTDDENAKRLLNYLNEIQKDMNKKKFGLVFEEYREKIDQILETNIPILSEKNELLLDNSKDMNFLIEGDNLASLEILSKTHKEKIDVIYIDPPYNTGNKDFIYDDDFVEKDDSYKHSKWISFMERRLQMAKKVLSKDGIIILSIGHQEVNNLVLLCEELFPNKQVASVTIQTSGGKPSGGFNYLHEYLIFITSSNFEPNPIRFAGGNTRSPFEGLPLSTFDKTQRPNQTYPIFIDKDTHQIVGTGLSLNSRVKDGIYNGDLSNFAFDFNEAPEGTVAVWPISSKGGECVWRLIPSRLMRDWEKGYIKVSKNRLKNHPNKYSIQYLPEGVVDKIEKGLLEVIGFEKGAPTLIFGENKTVGSDIPTIWTEKDFYTTKGTSLIKELIGEKKFPYPKPLELICEVLRATSRPNSIVLDFFAGSGTTGQAVMELNKEDKGTRKFILCTNNQNNICRDVTYERLRKANEKYDYGMGLKYFRIDFLSIENRFFYEYADELLKNIRELVELENAINFNGNKEVAILLTDSELDEFIENFTEKHEYKVIYLGHNVLPNTKQTSFFNRYKIKVNIIPDYYFKDKRG